nr:outer membrane lipoprotein-sorting protein [Oceanococcus sp. HetDA_MAG_MS8]
MRRGVRWLWVAVGMLVVGFAPARSLQELQDCMRANLPSQSLVQEVRLVAHDRSGARELQAHVYGMKLDQEVAVMLRILAPSDMSGSRYLVISGPERDAMYLYLPALNRTRRIGGSMAGQSLWGTDFSYEDVKLLRGLLTHGSAQLEAEVEWQQRPAQRVRIRPSSEESSQYQQVDLTVDDATCVIVHGDFADAAGPVKELRVAQADDLQEVGGQWWARRVELHSLREQTHSELYIQDYRMDPDLRSGLFDPRSFQRGR